MKEMTNDRKRKRVVGGGGGLPDDFPTPDYFVLVN